ncbi:hypothetical protein BHM03_00013608 [Ensete ventricosum]|nr:hypothetical protein BHM03_00013608 [Ensete ventricosum]
MGTHVYNLQNEDIIIGFKKEEEEEQEIKGGKSRWALRRTTDRLQAQTNSIDLNCSITLAVASTGVHERMRWPGTDTARREGKAGVGGEGGMMAYCLFCGASLGGRLPGTKSIDVSGAVPVSLRSFSEERVPFYGENVALFSS